MEEILQQFNAGQMDAATACERLSIGRARLYQLRHEWLSNKSEFRLGPSGGNHHPTWPQAAHLFLKEFLPHCKPVNFALMGDELAARFDLHRSRAAVAAYVRLHFPQLIDPLRPGPKPRRRWQTAAIGELWQHDSSPHQWWIADHLPTLLLTVDDHSRKIVAGSFVRSDTTWNHFAHLRSPIETFGLPACCYTDGLSLFGHRSTADRLDTHSQFQRAFTALGATHRVAPDAPAKGKIERRFGTFQNRLVSLLAYQKIDNYPDATTLLQSQIAWHNQKRVCRTTGMIPDKAWDLANKEGRSKLLPQPPKTLLDLHLALHLQRRLNRDFTVDFLGQTWHVSPTPLKTVTIIHHPNPRFWIVAHSPTPNNQGWPDILGSYTL